MAEETEFYFHWKSGVNFWGSQYEDLDIQEMDGDEGEFSGVDLTGCTFRKCSFNKATFQNVELNKCTFIDCNLSGADFDFASGSNVCFVSCKLEGATFLQADMSELFLSTCEGAVVFEDTRMQGVSINESDLQGSRFDRANLCEAKIIDSDITGTVFANGVWLDDAQIAHTIVTDVKFSGIRNPKKGAKKVDLSTAIVMPFLITGAKNATLGQTLTPQGGSIYKGVDRTAHLYCADLKEFQSVGKV